MGKVTKTGKVTYVELDGIFENEIDNIIHKHNMKAHSGNHTLSHHSTKSIPRAYVGKPTCFGFSYGLLKTVFDKSYF